MGQCLPGSHLLQPPALLLELLERAKVGVGQPLILLPPAGISLFRDPKFTTYLRLGRSAFGYLQDSHDMLLAEPLLLATLLSGA